MLFFIDLKLLSGFCNFFRRGMSLMIRGFEVIVAYGYVCLAVNDLYSLEFVKYGFFVILVDM